MAKQSVHGGSMNGGSSELVPHAGTHAANGTDPIPAASIGAATSEAVADARAAADGAADGLAAHVGGVGDAHGAATPAVAGFMAADDKAKLDGIEAGASHILDATAEVAGKVRLATDAEAAAGAAVNAAVMPPQAYALAGARPGDNILINTDFRNVINQRGQSDLEPAVGFGPDRWRFGSSHTTTSTGTGLRWDLSAGGILNQVMELPERFRGKVLTLSARLRTSGVNSVIQARVISGGATRTLWAANTAAATDWTEVRGTFTCPDDITFLDVGLWTGAAGWIELAWMKLEEGAVATPWTAPDPQIELARCQRYCLAVRNAQVYMAAAPSNFKTFYGTFYYPVPMRTVPSIMSPAADDLADLYLHVPGVGGNHPLTGAAWGSASTVCCQAAAAVDVTPTWGLGAPGRLFIPNRPIAPYLLEAEVA